MPEPVIVFFASSFMAVRSESCSIRLGQRPMHEVARPARFLLGEAYFQLHKGLQSPQDLEKLRPAWAKVAPGTVNATLLPKQAL